MPINLFLLQIFSSKYFSAVGYSFWLDERQRRRHNGLSMRRTRKHKDKVPSFFYTTRIRNPPDVPANESPIFGEDEQMWKGTQVLREHIQSDSHQSSELRKWWFSRYRKFYSHILLLYSTHESSTRMINWINNRSKIKNHEFYFRL